MTQTHFTSTLRVTVNGQALPDDVLVLLTEAFVDSNLRLPPGTTLLLPSADELAARDGQARTY